ncbi:LOW QUALITY PROTEIN: dicer-like protein 4 [Punica granatum]|uniref:LOW QUALITY PROTEIN: dicer-like protein 4 n=1 Tax=Punica granatum TaxID=22663 RepID=A0A6P8CH62_PUNGR|nr:LOW QUALITY PROTEIN: dicer-like protein 4 [Punica granatum]
MEAGSGAAVKDPRKIARKYQMELCKKALEENIIVYLGTGLGKTHIAVLLMYELRHLIKKPQKNIFVFLAPTVALGQQQAKVIADSTDFKVSWYSGGSKRLKSHEEWEKELTTYEVFVMTPMLLLSNLSHCFIKMDSIALLIFDECHHAQVKSNHPYAEIMRVFYKADLPNPPRIFGMTASPIVGKGASDADGLPKSINSLETLLNAKVYSVENSEELDCFVSSPVYKVHYYDSLTSGMSDFCATCFSRLEDIRRMCISNLNRIGEDHQKLRKTKKMLNRMHDNIAYCAEKLGFYGAVQACKILLGGDSSDRSLMIEEEGNASDCSLSDLYLSEASDIISSYIEDNGMPDISSVEILKKPFFSSKLLSLVGVLSSIRLQENMKCIIFVNRIVTARTLNYIIQNLTVLSSWKSDYLVGVHSVLKSMSRRTTNIALDKFRSGKLNLLVATKVGEEGLDIQTCCLVIRFDLPENVSSFIQSRGRARMPQSEYIFLVDRGNNKELDLIETFKKDEDRMNFEVTARTSNEEFSGIEDRIYKVDSSGAAVSSGYSTSLLHEYCAKLPHDEYFDPKVKFYYFDDLDGTVCHIILPPNAPIHQIVSAPQPSMEAAKKEACLHAIETLHELGSLNDFLLAHRDKPNEDQEQLINSFPHRGEDDSSREELHEMLVPDALSEPWSYDENAVVLCSYYMHFRPDPADRAYKTFSLFLKSPLPEEAEKLELDLHLARGRSVMTKLVPTGPVVFGKDEIVLAQNFQEMCLRVILDRFDFVSEYVALGKSNSSRSSMSKFYLLLPVTLGRSHKTISIDWTTIRRCLTSPIFGRPANSLEDESRSPPFDLIILANGTRSRSNVENSLVYVPHKNCFFFVTNINYKKNGHSLYKETDSTTVAEFLRNTFEISLKYPWQPLLHVKPLFNLRNLLHNRKQEEIEAHELDEYFIDVPPELCELKIMGFSKDIGSSMSLLPSLMHRLENLLVAVQLKDWLASSFPEGAKVTASRVLEALTTERCQERFFIQVLGDLVESSVGAILLDNGFDLHCTWKIMLSFLKPMMSFTSFQLNPIRDLQELCQSRNWDLKFSTVKRGTLYIVEAHVIGEDIQDLASATSLSKKDAIRTSAGKLFLQLKAKGYLRKVKSLEEVLRTCEKMEARLIGFDETPIQVISPIYIEAETSNNRQFSNENKRPKKESVPKGTGPRKPLVKQQQQQTNELLLSKPVADPQAPDGLAKKSARSRLFEICAANCWKPPTFDCCKEDGPGHLKMFTYMVVIEIEESPQLLVECYGEPRSKKKAAAEHAAEGVLWYLKHEGYLLKGG